MYKFKFLLFGVFFIFTIVFISTFFLLRKSESLMARMKIEMDTDGNKVLSSSEVARWLQKHHKASPLYVCLSSSVSATDPVAQACAALAESPFERSLVERFDSDNDSLISDTELYRIADAADDLPDGQRPTDMVSVGYSDNMIENLWYVFAGVAASAVIFLVSITVVADRMQKDLERSAAAANVKDSEVRKLETDLLRLEHEKNSLNEKLKERPTQDRLDKASVELNDLRKSREREQVEWEAEVARLKRAASGASKKEQQAAEKKVLALEATNKARQLEQLAVVNAKEAELAALRAEALEAKKQAERLPQLEEELSSKSGALRAAQEERQRLQDEHNLQMHRAVAEHLNVIAMRFHGDALPRDNPTMVVGDDDSHQQRTLKETINRALIKNTATQGFTIDVFGTVDGEKFCICVQELGSGKTGARLVENIRNEGEKFAMKKYTISDKDSEKDLRNELLACDLPAHPNVCQYIKVIITKNTGYVMMERLQGADFMDFVCGKRDKSETISEAVAKKAFRQIMDGLKHMHSNNVLHLDIKPENVFVNMTDADSPQVKLIDFGCACFLDHGGGNLGWGEGGAFMMGGSFAPPDDSFTPPWGLSVKEQVRMYGQLDDIYRAGGVLYAMLVQDLPIAGFQVPLFKALSPSCQNLLKLLLSDRRSRPRNCDEVLKHAWFK